MNTASAPLPFASAFELTSDETVLARLTLDLDGNLRFARGEVVLTSLRLFGRMGNDAAWQQWSLQPSLTLRHHDHAGVGTIELHDASAKLAGWRYTLGHNLEALFLITQFEKRQAALAGNVAEPEEQDDKDEDEADFISNVEEQSPSTASLFRLWRFAKPYRGQLLLGFILTLASTAARWCRRT